MFRHKPANAGGVAAVVAAGLLAPVDAADTADSRPDPARRAAAPPQLSSADQAYLIRWVRETLAAAVAGRRPTEPRDVPPAIVKLKCPAVVTLRSGGRVLALGRGEGQPNVAASCRQAVLNALDEPRTPLDRHILKRLRVEVELLGPAEQLPVGRSDPTELIRRYQPGLHGVAARAGDRNALIRPSQIIASGLSVDQAVAFVTDQLGLPEDQPRDPKGQPVYLRFRTLHFWQPRPDGPVTELRRGCRLVAADEVTADGLDQAIRRIARHLRDQQRADGSFAKAYLPWADRREGSAPVIAQAGGAWALAAYGNSAQDAAATTAARRTVDALAKQLVPLDRRASQPGTRGAITPGNALEITAAYLKSPRQADRLGATAILLLAAAEIRPVATYRGLRQRLAAAVLARQLPTGMMQTNFVTTRSAAPQDTDPGQALLAVARSHALDRNPTALPALANAFGHYRKQFAVQPTVAMVPWLARAYAQVGSADLEGRYAKFVFRMIDWLAERQLTPADCPWPLMHGGIDPLGYRLAGVSTALHMTAVADALALARRVGDRDRAARYQGVLRSGTRFVLQLQFRPEECYYPRSRLDTIGGVRTTPWNHALTIENAQHALIALIQARQVLSH